MAVTFFPFNSIVVDGVPDRPANAENLAAYLAGFFSNGVLMQEDTALKVEASSGMNVQIRAGMGNINGRTILADAAEIITLDTASASLDRIDRVVFRLDEVNRLMEFAVLTGTPASSPVAPALTQGADVYELCLAEIRVPAGATSIAASYITDTRSDTELCGVASIPEHAHDAINIISGILSVDRLPVTPISKGGHGKTTADAGLLALGGVNIKKVWSNASPTSDFAAQTISATLSSNQLALIEHKIDKSTNTYGITLIRVGTKGVIEQTTDSSNANNVRVTRTANVKTSGVVFGAGYGKSVGSSSAGGSSASNLIPTAIYVTKGVQ